MKTKKLRGQKKINKSIDNWVEYNHLPNIDEINSYGKDYIKCNIDPWNRLSLTWSKLPQPKGDFKRRIIKGLLKKYEVWDTFLESKLENYELRLIIHSHEISKCWIEAIKLEKGEKSNYDGGFSEELDIDGLVIQGFRWYREDDIIYLDDEDLELNSKSDAGERSYVRRFNKKINKNNIKKDNFGNYPVPSGTYYYVGIRS